ncbi:MAG: T9SS type A sorting domain-containing protein [Bacteroidales bacterium]|nr:T9SS type A sorting domain-containing protein [Bacteroidales bacterium]
MEKIKQFLSVLLIAIVSLHISQAQTSKLSIENGPDMLSPHLGSINMPYILLDTNNSTTLFKILVMGGRDYDFVSSSKAEIYDYETNSFSLLEMNYPHDFSSIVRLDNNNYLIAGGSANLGVHPGFSDAEIFNPVKNTFTPVASMIHKRMDFSMAKLKSNNVLIVGGWNETTSPTYPEIYKVDSNSYTQTVALNTPRTYPIVLPTNDSGAVVIGGYHYLGSPYLEQVEYYDYKNNSFSILTERPIDTEEGWLTKFNIYHCDMESLKMSNGKYLLLFYNEAVDSTEFCLISFDPETLKFEKIPLSTKIKVNHNEKWIFSIVLDKAQNIAYLPGCVSTTPMELLIYSIDLNNGNVYQPDNSVALETDIYPASSSYTLLPNNKILMTGLSNKTGTKVNFGATNKTLLLSTSLITSINNINKPNIQIINQSGNNNLTVLNSDHSIKNIIIVNTNGQLISNNSINFGYNNIDISFLPKGFYILKAESFNNVVIKKFNKY